MKGLSKDAATWLEVDESGVGQRIDNFLLRTCKGVPKSHVYRILRSGEVRVNKGRIGPEYRLNLGDAIRVPPMRVAEPRVAAPGAVLPLVFEDEALLVVAKPAGVAVHGGSGINFGIIEQLRRQRPQARFLELAHRLDKETSGLLLVAKKRAALVRLHDMFREGRIAKHYLALAKGRWQADLQHVRLPLLKYLTEAGERRVTVSSEGRQAHSILRLAARWENFSLLEVAIKTGRTHQIRVHLAHLDFPLAGDEKYGDFSLNRDLYKAGLRRMFLHAARLSFRHPLTGREIRLAMPLPPELQDFLRRLGSHEVQDYGERDYVDSL